MIACLESIAPLSTPLRANAFYFLRHGRTDHNLQCIVQGHLDIPLDDTGRAEADAAASVFDGLISRIVSSDLSRTRETAERIGDLLGLSPAFDAGLRERCLGKFQGQPAFPTLWDWIGDGVEPIDVFAQRLESALKAAIAAPGVLIVAHGGVLRVLGRLLRADLPDGALRNAAPLRFSQTAGHWRIVDLAATHSSAAPVVVEPS